LNLLNLIRTRRSIRRYTNQPVSSQLIDQLLEAAIWAPSAHNRQPWRFAVVTTPEMKARLADEMGAHLRADRTRDGDPAEAIERDVSRSRERIVSAPVVIVACLSMLDMDRYPDERRASSEHSMAAQGVAMAIQNLLLMAHSLGLGACWMCAPLFCPDAVRAALDLPDDWEAQALITIGYPTGADQGKPRGRVDYHQRTVWK
jgi:coenzyme F420-0:L-glutamate ligase/coenzyme F420-1:gamma-L-glutamate ligase